MPAIRDQQCRHCPWQRFCRTYRVRDSEAFRYHASGFVVLPMALGIVEAVPWRDARDRCRRLAKDFENLRRNALAFLRLSASIRLMLRKLFAIQFKLLDDSQS